MSQWSALKRTYHMAKKLKQYRGGFFIRYFADAIWCGYRHGASPENYFVLRFYELSEKERSVYLTSGRSSKADKRLNEHMTLKENRIMSQKHLFYEVFSGLVGRNYLYLKDSTYAKFLSFLEKNEWVILKPDRGIMGHGIEKIHTPDIEKKQDFYEKYKAKEYLLEQVIIQHEELEKISPGCVNSVRINAARDQNGKVHLIGACLKCGMAGAAADNFHSGGIAYPLDMKSGVVSGAGRNNTDLSDYEIHPETQIRMMGVKVPYWREVLGAVFLAMERLPAVGYVGWDIAVTPDGPELIEGNCHFPGGNIIQFDRIGKYPLLLECLGKEYLEEIQSL